MRKAGVPREVCDSDRDVLPIRTVHLVFDSERTVHHATGDPFVSWTLRWPNENSRLARGSGLLPSGVRRASPPASGGRACHASNSARSGVRVLSVNAARRVASVRSVFRGGGA